MNNFDLTKFLAEGKLHEGTMAEALNKPLVQLGPALEKRMKSSNFEVKIIPNQISVPSDAKDAISQNSKLAAIAFGESGGREFMEVVVNKDRLKDLTKVRDYFNIPSGAYGPDKDMGWVVKNVRNVNAGDITASKAESVGNVGILTFFRAEKANDDSTGVFGTQSIKSTNKMAAEGKLHEFTDAISPEEVRDMAQMVADEFSYEDAQEGGSSMVYMVGNVDGMRFELDTKATNRTPAEDAKYGTGEGWGGNFSIKPTEDGYEVRNGEKGGLVATMDGSGFTMLDAEQSKAEMGGDTDYMERRKEMSDYMQEGEDEDDREDDELSPEELANKYAGSPMREADEDEVKEIKTNKMKKSELKEMIKAAMMADTAVYEAEDVEVTDDEDIDVDIEKDVKVDDEESEVDIDINAELPGEDGDVTEVLALLMKSQQAAEDIGDEKLMDQIGNTITYFTRSHVANVNEADLDMDLDSAAGRAKEATIGLDETEELDEKKQGYNDELDDSEGAKHGKKKQDMAQRRADSENMEKADGKRKYSGDKSKDLNESVTFPMWNKIK